MVKKSVGLLAALGLGSSLLFAHDSWIVPDRFRLNRAGSVILSLTSGMGFPALDHAIDVDRVAVARMRVRGKVADLTRRTKGSHAQQLRADVAGPGVATFWVELKPRFSELKPEQVREYLEEVGATETVWPVWNAKPESKRFTYFYTKYAKTFVRAGNPRNDRSWREAAGLRYELIPQNDPTTLHAGDSLELLLLENGALLRDFPVSVSGELEKEAWSAETDRNGMVSIPLKHSGRYLVRATKMRASSSPEAEWETHFTTLTVEALPRHRRR